MTLYYVWWEDSTQNTDHYEQRQTAVHETGLGGGGETTGDNAGSNTSAPSSGHGGKGGGKGKLGRGGIPPPPPPPAPKPKQKKPKTGNQLARAVSWLLHCSSA